MQAGSHPGSFSGNSRAFERAAEALREKYERDRAAGDPDARASLELASKFDAAAARARTREQERTVPPDRPTFAGHRLGRLVLRLTVGALVFAALLAIGALLGGDLGETEGRILLAVLSLWVFSLAFSAAPVPRLRTVRQDGWSGNSPRFWPPLRSSSALQ